MGKLALIPLGFIFIVLSPIILWNAESQNRAGDFNRAESTSSVKAGYLKVTGAIESAEEFACPAGSRDENNKCVYASFTTRQYSRSEKEQCTSNTRNLKVIERLEKQQCDDSGNCVPCYLVEELNWEVVDSGKQFAQSSIGEFSLEAVDSAIILGTRSYTKFESGQVNETNGSNEPTSQISMFGGQAERETEPVTTQTSPSSRASAKVGDFETVHEYIVSGSNVIVVASSDSTGRLTKGDSTFVVSTLSEADTLARLSDQDASSASLLRVVSAVSMILGFLMIANGILGLPLGLLKVVPIFGQRIAKGINGVVNMAAGVLGIVAWIIAYIGVIVLKNILLVGILIALVLAAGVGVIYVLNKRKLAQSSQDKI